MHYLFYVLGNKHIVFPTRGPACPALRGFTIHVLPLPAVQTRRPNTPLLLFIFYDNGSLLPTMILAFSSVYLSSLQPQIACTTDKGKAPLFSRQQSSAPRRINKRV